MSAFLYAVAGIVVGGFISFLLSRYYYQRAGEELRAESRELRRLTSLILHGLEEARLIDLSYDEETGEIRDLILTDTFYVLPPETERHTPKPSPDDTVTVTDTFKIKPKPKEHDPDQESANEQ
jgi:hypothetical protein